MGRLCVLAISERRHYETDIGIASALGRADSGIHIDPKHNEAFLRLCYWYSNVVN